MLKPQDVMIMLKIVTMHQREWKYSEVALELGMSPSEVHSGVKRLKRCNLLSELRMDMGGAEQKLHLPDIDALKEFMQHGIMYVFPAVYGKPAKGLPTSYGVEHLFEGYGFTGGFIPVWELEVGEYVGASVKPLYTSAPKAAMNDFQLYELLALTDAMRSEDKQLRDFAWGKMNLMLGA
jgi:AraC-like DNA-binding protein